MTNLTSYFSMWDKQTATLIKLNDEVMLIDAGNNADGKNVVSFLQAKNIIAYRLSSWNSR